MPALKLFASTLCIDDPLDGLNLLCDQGRIATRLDAQTQQRGSVFDIVCP
jgi:hypothetical protein